MKICTLLNTDTYVFFSENGGIFISFVFRDNIYFYEYEDINFM